MLILTGNLDRGCASQLDSWLEGAMREGHRTIGLDLSRLKQLDARGRSLLVAAHERLRALRRMLRVVSANPTVQAVLTRHDLGYLMPAAADTDLGWTQKLRRG